MKVSGAGGQADLPGAAVLLDERRALRYMIPRMEESMRRGAQWLKSQFAPNGPIMKERDLSFCHKVVWGLYEAGEIDSARKILDWIAENAYRGPARYYFPEEPPFNKELQLLYRFLTFGKIAERLNHPAFCSEETREEVLTYQHSCGGVWGNKDKSEYMESITPLVTSFFTEWALAAGLVEPAERSADFLAMLVEKNQPYMSTRPGRFYFNYDPREERLITEPKPGEEINCFVDTVKPKQQFYQIGTSMAALADMYATTHKKRHLEAALRLAEFEARLNPRGLRWPSYCKIGWGAAHLYSVTAQPEHRISAANVSEITFISSQLESGGWADFYYPLRDHGAWEQVEYDGRAAPGKIQDDGSWARLAGHEIAGEFMGEMGRTLHVFEEALDKLEKRLRSIGL